MPNIDLPPGAKTQIAEIMFVKEANIFLEFVLVQEQYGHSDCGVFVIAFATSLCAGHSPAKTTYIRLCKACTSNHSIIFCKKL